MHTRLVAAAVAAALSLIANHGFAQTQPPQTNAPALSDEKAKPQQNAADESAPRGTLEAGKDPTGSNDPKVMAAEKAKK